MTGYLYHKRHRLGLSRKEVAERMGVSVSYYAALEQGKRKLSNMRLDKAVRLAEVLDCPVTYFMKEDSYEK